MNITKGLNTVKRFLFGSGEFDDITESMKSMKPSVTDLTLPVTDEQFIEFYELYKKKFNMDGANCWDAKVLIPFDEYKENALSFQFGPRYYCVMMKSSMFIGSPLSKTPPMMVSFVG